MNQLALLLDIARFNVMKSLAYPWELAAFFARKIIYLLFLSFFWFAVSKSSSTALNFKQLIAYFLLSTAVLNLVFANSSPFAKYIFRRIRNGDLSNFLIRPLPTISFLFSSFFGENLMNIVYAFITTAISIVLVPPHGILNLALFVVFIVFALFTSISINILIASLSFYFVEVNGIKNSFDHIRTILSGSIIPLTMFPPAISKIVMYTPFPLLAFTPTYVLQNSLPIYEILQMLLVAVVWSSGLFALMLLAWNKSIKRYEGVGI